MKKSQLKIKNFLSYIVVLNSIIFASTAFSKVHVCIDTCQDEILQETYKGGQSRKNYFERLKKYCSDQNLNSTDCKNYESEQIFKKRFAQCDPNSAYALLMFEFQDDKNSVKFHTMVVAQKQLQLSRDDSQLIDFKSEYKPNDNNSIFEWDGTNLTLSGDNAGLVKLKRTSDLTKGLFYTNDNIPPNEVLFYDAILTAKKDHSSSAKIYTDVKVRCFESDEKL